MNSIIKYLGKKYNGTINIPGDKSISIRIALLSNLFYGDFDIQNFNYCKDVKTMLRSIDTLKNIDIYGNDCDCSHHIDSKMDYGHSHKKQLLKINCENSATTMRLLAGFISAMYMGQNITFILTGDNSLCSRPMARIITPLRKMGIDIYSKNENQTAPLYINCGNYNKLKDITYINKISSAQVKSCLQIASLIAGTKLKYKEPYKSRNHTELMIKHFKSLHTHDDIPTFTYTVPSDISTASYYIANAILYKDSVITMKNIGINNTRTGFFSCLKKMGVKINFSDKQIIQNEPTATIKITNKDGIRLKPIFIDKSIVVSMIDEIPLLAILLASADGISKLSDIGELHYKESDRIVAIIELLKLLNIKYKETKTSITIYGDSKQFYESLSQIKAHIKNAPKSLLNTKDHRILLILKLLNIPNIKHISYINISV